MKIKKNLAYLLLYVAFGHPQYAFAALFCATTSDGKVVMDKCKYASYDECKNAPGNHGDCVADVGGSLSSTEVAPYCIVTWGIECKYYDYETCNKTAEKNLGFCYLNPDYKTPDK